MKKRILIVSFNFWPEQNPRSFRAYELAKEFNRRRYLVTVITKKLNLDRGIPEPFNLIEVPSEEEDINLHLPRIPQKQASGCYSDVSEYIKNGKVAEIKIPQIFQFWKYFIWPSFRHYRFCKKCLTKLLPLRSKFEFDLTISVALPIVSHLLTYKLQKYGFQLGTIVADYGDPFTFNPAYSFSVNNYFHERKLMSCYDFITVPTAKAMESYTKLGFDAKKIRIIPQGFSFELTETSSSNQDLNFIKLKKPSIIYGGRFYENIRDPENFFKALQIINSEGSSLYCYIFTNLREPYAKFLHDKYALNRNGLISFVDTVSRDNFLKLLKQTDYAVNFLNKSDCQEPSKTIDYALTEVKTFDIDSAMNCMDIVNKIRSEDYYIPALDPGWDIRHIAQQFVSLI
jgi:hypothetical protein